MTPIATTRPLKIGIAAALVLMLTAAQDSAQRFRYIGEADQFAVLSSEATGPRSARMSIVVIAAGQQAGPGGSDTFVISMRSDCDGNSVQMMSATAYAGTEKLNISPGAAEAHPPEPDTPYAPAFAYACTGKAPDGPAVWIDGADAARAYALKRAREAQ